MRPWLHALLLLGVLLMFGVSFVLLSQVIGLRSPWLVLLLMFYCLGLAKIAEPLIILRMPSALRSLRPWERDGTVYPRLGVLRFGRFLRQSPLRYLNAAVYLNRERSDLLQVCQRAESSEASHFWVAVLLMPYLLFAGLQGQWSVVAWFALAQGIVNVYPILHLRHIRGRLDRVLGRAGRQAEARPAAANPAPADPDTY
jgi:hypothetical protein